MKHEVVILPGAFEDVAQIAVYIARDNRTAAHAMVDRLMAAMKSLEQNPRRGAIIKDRALKRRGFRYLVVAPYLVFYRMEGEAVHVHRVLHGRQGGLWDALEYDEEQ